MAKTLSKPRIDDLSTSIEVWNGDNVRGNPAVNPELSPWLAKQIDFNYGWKFSGWNTLLSIGGFYKGINTSIIYNKEAATIPGDSSYSPEIIRPINKSGGYIRSFKLLYKEPFTFLPAPFNRFGISADYAYAESNIKQGITHTITGEEYSIIGLSNKIANIVLWYDYKNLAMGISAEYKDSYFDKIGSGSEFGLIKAATY